MKAVAVILVLGFLALGWYSFYEVTYVEHRVVEGQEWVGFAVMGLYTLMFGSLLARI